MTECPKCKFVLTETVQSCPRCHVIFSKLKAADVYRTCSCGKQVLVKQGDICPHCDRTEEEYVKKPHLLKEIEASRKYEKSMQELKKRNKERRDEWKKLSFYQKAKDYLFLVTTGIIVFIAIASLLAFYFTRESNSDSVDTRDAYIYAKQFVEMRLKSPSSANFSSFTESSVRFDKASGKYTVSGWVDAQNSFGANIRSRFYVVVRRGSGSWELESCDVRP